MNRISTNYVTILLVAVSFSGCFTGCDSSVNDPAALLPGGSSSGAARSWSRPVPVHVAPYTSNGFLLPTCVNSNRSDRVNMLVRVPLDTLSFHLQYEATLMEWSASGWHQVTTFDGHGFFDPCTIYADTDDTHLLWSGVRPERLNDWETRHIRASDYYYANCRSGSCRLPNSVFPSQGRQLPPMNQSASGRLFFIQPVVDDTDEVWADAPYTVWNRTTVGTMSSPHLISKNGTDYFIHLGFSQSGSGLGNVIHYSFRETGTEEWSPIETVFDVPGRQGHFPRLAISDAGTVHAIFYVADGDGWHFTHSIRRENGWSEPERVHSFPYLVFAIPTVYVRKDGSVLSVWNHLGENDGEPGTAAFFGRWTPESGWNEPVPLFKDYVVRTPVRTALDTDDNLHAVFLSSDSLIYHSILR